MRINNDKFAEMKDLANLTDSYYRNLINSNIDYIENQCFKACQLDKKKNIVHLNKVDNYSIFSPGVNLNENDAIELFNEIIKKLSDNKFTILKNFEKRSSIKTYLNVIISRQFIDMLRKKKGRSKLKERAARFGKIGELLYQQVILEGNSLKNIYSNLKSEQNITESIEEIDEILFKIKGNDDKGSLINTDIESNPVLKDGRINTVNDEIVISDTQNGPEAIYLKNEKKKVLKNTLSNILENLETEDRFILRMRFQIGPDGKKMKVDEIAEALDMTKKGIYTRLRRILLKCRKEFEKMGIGIEDLIG